LRHHLGLRRKSADLRAIELLEMVRIPDPAKRLRQYPYELSGGMRQRVAIATALACGPRLLIADEPTTALDVTVQAQILELIESLQRESGMAMILVSHDLSIIRDRVQKTLIMYAGKVVESGETAVTFDHPHHPYTAALIAAMPRLDAPAGTPLRPIAGGPPDLVDLRPGCAFAPRCEYARLLCSRTTPVVTHLGASREVRCHFPLEASLGDLGTSARPFVGGASATAAS
ncbi:MAG: peptide transporter ATPase, partial [Acidimicrobiaceae bacterium]|nr:peptide transporter ATPase [Acidimicrobiaceae bacterium]